MPPITRDIALAVVALAAFASFSGCTSKLNYDSHPVQQALHDLSGKRVLLLRVDYKSDLILDEEPLDRSLGERAAAAYKASLTAQLAPQFTLIDVAQAATDKYGVTADFTDPNLAAQALRDLGGDGGLVVTVGYAYKMQGGSIKEHAEEEALKTVVPEKVVNVLAGPSQIERYDFASRTILLSLEGRPVWDLFCKGSAMPTFSSMFRPMEFARSVAGLDPSSENLLLKMSQISDGYAQYAGWVLQQDTAGVVAKNYFQDYPSERKDKDLVFFPAETETFVPWVKGHSPLH